MPDTPLNPDALSHAKAAAVDCRINGGSTEDVAECAVEAYLAVAQPEVNSVEELDALPLTSVVRTHHGWVYQLRGFGWVATGLSDAVAHIDVLDFFPARVLYRPETTNGR